MKTKLKNFCLQFSSELDPFIARLEPAIVNLTDKSGEAGLAGLREIATRLQGVQTRSRALQQKIANQHAYLLIFGPLKSGKSTLMNAISGAYVSEVSCLPTYPALVYVKDGQQNHFQATTYEGAERDFPDSLAMKAAIMQDYADLAEAIREAEKVGENFDPAIHHPKAIRRLEVQLPAPNLAESGTVLVDTPGLYSRMKFGYDQMTKDFRDTAACAIFVVKTDDLFFEKVFEEFEELLGCFSQIFLVSNIDSSKQDLQPDGTLTVSLEGSDPEKVIEAFQSLSISAPIQEAIDRGRLNIYSIDLLKAASRRLRAGLQSSVEAPETDPEINGEGDAGAESDGFDRFLDDLTGYLNSSDYLDDFMVDTLRTARDLVEEEIQASASEIAEELKEACKGLNADIYKERHLIDSLQELEKTDWSANFAHLGEEKDRLFSEAGESFLAHGESLQIALDEWMQSDESWQNLLDSRIRPLLKQGVRQDAEDTVEKLRAMLDSANGGGRFSTALSQKMSDAGLSVNKPVRELLASLGEAADVNLPEMELNFEAVPINHSFLDKLLFRNDIKVRQQLFGTEGQQPISAARKRKRLQGSGVEYLQDTCKRFASERLQAVLKEYADQVLTQYISRYTGTLQQEVSNLKASVMADIRENERKLQVREQVLEDLEGINAAAERFFGSLGSVAADFVTQTEAAADGEGQLSGPEEKPHVEADADMQTEAAESPDGSMAGTVGEEESGSVRPSETQNSEEQDGVVIEDWSDSEEFTPDEEESGIANK
ncbi:MAG: dynamin family protein [Gammaproteobacteria bacterium]